MKTQNSRKKHVHGRFLLAVVLMAAFVLQFGGCASTGMPGFENHEQDRKAFFGKVRDMARNNDQISLVCQVGPVYSLRTDAGFINVLGVKGWPISYAGNVWETLLLKFTLEGMLTVSGYERVGPLEFNLSSHWTKKRS